MVTFAPDVRAWLAQTRQQRLVRFLCEGGLEMLHALPHTHVRKGDVAVVVDETPKGGADKACVYECRGSSAAVGDVVTTEWECKGAWSRSESARSIEGGSFELVIILRDLSPPLPMLLAARLAPSAVN